MMTETLDAYEQRAQLYKEHTASSVPADLKTWMNRAVAGLSDSSAIFEIGSGTGRDATYLTGLGYKVQVSDAASSFVSMLAADGWDAIRFDVVKDELQGAWDLVFADAVLLHLARPDFHAVLGKIRTSLSPDGRFAFTLKSGDGEGYSEEKLGLPRFFCYWQKNAVESALRKAGYTLWLVEEHPGWLHVVANN